LSDYEATRKSVTTGNFLDMCNKCYGSISSEVLAVERTDLRHEDEDDEFHNVEKDDYFTMWEDKPLTD
jgi:hypothetical protein